MNPPIKRADSDGQVVDHTQHSEAAGGVWILGQDVGHHSAGKPVRSC